MIVGPPPPVTHSCSLPVQVTLLKTTGPLSRLPTHQRWCSSSSTYFAWRHLLAGDRPPPPSPPPRHVIVFFFAARILTHDQIKVFPFRQDFSDRCLNFVHVYHTCFFFLLNSGKYALNLRGENRQVFCIRPGVAILLMRPWFPCLFINSILLMNVYK